MKFDIESLKNALKTESKIDRIEAFMNMEDVGRQANKYIRQFMQKKENLEIFVSLVGRPHDVDSRVSWKPLGRINMHDETIFSNYKDFNLMEKKKFTQLVYINKHFELKNIYRSYAALRILLYKHNLNLILETVPEAFSRIVVQLKEAFYTKNNACPSHAVILLKALLSFDAEKTLELVQEHQLLVLLLQEIENREVSELLFKLITNDRDSLSRRLHRQFIKHLIESKFLEALLDMQNFSRAKLDRLLLQVAREGARAQRELSPRDSLPS